MPASRIKHQKCTLNTSSVEDLFNFLNVLLSLKMTHHCSVFPYWCTSHTCDIRTVAVNWGQAETQIRLNFDFICNNCNC